MYDPPAELSLWGTGLSDAGATSLARALARNKHLKHLWLGECEGISDEGASVLRESLHANDALEQLTLVMSGVSDELQEDITDLVAARRQQRALAC